MRSGLAAATPLDSPAISRGDFALGMRAASLLLDSPCHGGAGTAAGSAPPPPPPPPAFASSGAAAPSLPVVVMALSVRSSVGTTTEPDRARSSLRPLNRSALKRRLAIEPKEDRRVPKPRCSRAACFFFIAESGIFIWETVVAGVRGSGGQKRKTRDGECEALVEGELIGASGRRVSREEEGGGVKGCPPTYQPRHDRGGEHKDDDDNAPRDLDPQVAEPLIYTRQLCYGHDPEIW